MTLLFILAILLLAIAAALVVRALTITRVRIASQVRQVESYGFNAADQGVAASGERPSKSRLTERAERIGIASDGPGWRAMVPGLRLRSAGLYRITPEAFHGYRVMGISAMLLLTVLDLLAGGKLTVVLLMLIASAIVWQAPATFVRTRAERRMDRIDRDLPELIDLLIATIEAGLGFAGSLQLVANRFDGPLGQELRLTLREQSMGLSTERALENMLDRCDTPSVRSFVRAVSQGEALGVSIGAMMRNLASETRKRRRQKANEQVQKAPVKMLFPLVFLVFPALLIVLLYPAIHQLSSQLGGS